MQQQQNQQVQTYQKDANNEKKNKKNSKNTEYELYKRIKLLGEGAFGKAYLVECLKDKTKWVIKQMCMNAMCPEEKKTTYKEAKILEALEHPNIVQFKEVYKTKKGKLCIVMEYADGGDLQQKIKDAKGNLFPEKNILDWFTQICLALKHVHDRKIIHRDLKGQNVFLTKEGRIKLGDFGIARVLTKTYEKCKTMVGTPYYLSPEIIENKPYSFQSDIWSLGVLLYEMCAHEPPFTADSMHFLALRIVRGNFKPIPNKYSRGLQKLVESLLQIDADKRPTVHQILKTPVIQNRILAFLSETVKKEEFDHTILHNKNIVINTSQDDHQFNNINVVNRELPMPPRLLQEHIKQEKLQEIQKQQQNKLPSIQHQQQIQQQNQQESAQSPQNQQYPLQPIIPSQQQVQQRDIKTAQQQYRKKNKYLNNMENNNNHREIQTPQPDAFKKKPQNNNNNFNNFDNVQQDKPQKQQIYPFQKKVNSKHNLNEDDNINNINQDKYNNKLQDIKIKPQTPGPNNIRKQFGQNKYMDDRVMTPKESNQKFGNGGFQQRNNSNQVFLPSTKNNNNNFQNPLIKRQQSQPEVQFKYNNNQKNYQQQQQIYSNRDQIIGNREQHYNNYNNQQQEDNQYLNTQEEDYNDLPSDAKNRLDFIKKKHTEEAKKQLQTGQEKQRQKNIYLKQKQQASKFNNFKDSKQLAIERMNRAENREKLRQQMKADINEKRKTIKKGQKIQWQDQLPQEEESYNQEDFQQNDYNQNEQVIQQNQQDVQSLQSTEDTMVNTPSDNNNNNNNQNFYNFRPISQQQQIQQQQQQQQQQMQLQQTPSKNKKNDKADPFGLARPKTGHKKKMEQQQYQQQKEIRQQANSEKQLQNNQQGYQKKEYDADKNIEQVMYAQQQAKNILHQSPKNFDIMVSELQNLIVGVNNAVDKLPPGIIDENKNYFDQDMTVNQEQNETQQTNDNINEAQQFYQQQQQQDYYSNQQTQNEMPSQIQENEYEEDEEDREDDDAYIEVIEQQEQIEKKGFIQCQDTLTKLTKEQEESIMYMDQDYNKLSSLQKYLEDLMGQKHFDKAFQIVKKQVQLHPNISEIETKYGKDNYQSLFPFLSHEIIMKSIALLITLVVMEEKR